MRKTDSEVLREESGSAAGSVPTPGLPSQTTPETATLYVCTSCRLPGTPRGVEEDGSKLYLELLSAFRESPLGDRVQVRSAECLSICPRPCGIAFSSSGKWNYLFGDQRVGENVDSIMDCVSLYLDSSDGFLPRGQRPKPLRASILGRVPPPKKG